MPRVRPRIRSISTLAVALAAVLLSATPTAQVRPIYSRGVAGLVQAVERLRTTASAMHTAAHPDDEDTALITRLARGDHARVAYLSLNRGEQNIMHEMTRQFERALILKALAHTGGRRIEASHLLGMGRNTLTRKIQELGIEGKEAPSAHST